MLYVFEWKIIGMVGLDDRIHYLHGVYMNNNDILQLLRAYHAYLKTKTKTKNKTKKKTKTKTNNGTFFLQENHLLALDNEL